MQISRHQDTTICVLAGGDKVTDCPCGSYAVIEDCGFYVVALVMGDDFWTVHPDPVLTLEDALDIIAERREIIA